MAVYTAEQWSDPFDAQGQITVTPLLNGIREEQTTESVTFFPNPCKDWAKLKAPVGRYEVSAYDANGRLLLNTTLSNDEKLDVRGLPEGMVYLKLDNLTTLRASYTKMVICKNP